MSTFWHPDPESVSWGAFWQSRPPAESRPEAPERAGDGISPAAQGDGDAEPAAGFLEPPALFLTARALTPAEAAEFRRDWENLGCWIAAGVLGPPVLPGMTAPARAAGPCQDCGMDDLPPDDAGRCAYCAGLAALRARNLPGPPLSWWWYLVPSVLGLCLGLAAVWAVLYVLFYAL